MDPSLMCVLIVDKMHIYNNTEVPKCIRNIRKSAQMVLGIP